MTDLLAATAVFTLLVALALGVLAALTLVPFVLTLRAVEDRGLSSLLWGALALGGSLFGVAVVLAATRTDGTARLVLAVFGVAVAFAAPAAVRTLSTDREPAGRHI